MALKKKGNLAFALQAGATGPVADTTTGMYRRTEEWEGQETDLTSFLATKPPGSAHPAYPYLKVYEVEPTMNEAGMARVRITYTGHPTGASSPTLRFQRSLRTSSVSVKIVRRYERVISYAVKTDDPLSTQQSAAGYNYVYDIVWATVEDEADGEMAYSYYAPSVIYRYCRSNFVKSPQYQTQATQELSGQTPTILKQDVRQTGSQFTLRLGTNLTEQPLVAQPSDDPIQAEENRLLATKKNLVTFYEYQGSSTVNQPYLGTPTLRSTDLTTEQKGTMFEVEETWEVDLV